MPLVTHIFTARRPMDTRGSLHGPPDLPVMGGGFGDTHPFQHPEGGRSHIDGPAGFGVPESDVGHAQNHGHVETYDHEGLQSPASASLEEHRFATSPTSFPMPMSSIGSFETGGMVNAHGSAPRQTSTPQPWPASPRDYRNQQPDLDVNSITQALQQPHQAQMHLQQELFQMEQRQQRQHGVEQDNHQQSAGTLSNSCAGFERLGQQSKQQQQQQQQRKLQHRQELRRINSQVTSLEQYKPSGRCDQQQQQQMQRSWQGNQQNQQRAQAVAIGHLRDVHPDGDSHSTIPTPSLAPISAALRPEDVQIRSTPLFNECVPPAAFAQVSVQALMHQTSAIIARWKELQETLDVTSDSSTSNLSEQARARASLKRDLTNLTQLADAQTKYMQRIKMRCNQETPMSTGVSGDSIASTSLLASTTPAGRGGLTREEYNHPTKDSAIPVSAPRGAPVVPSPFPPENSIGAVLMHEGGDDDVRDSLTTEQQDRSEDPAAAWQPAEWPSSTPSPRQTGVPNPPSPALPPQQVISLQHRLHNARQRLDRAEPRNKWVVLVDACLRLMPHEGSAFEQFFVNIQSLLKNFNGPLGAEVAVALQSCFDERVFDPTDITRAQQRMADIYSQCARRVQR